MEKEVINEKEKKGKSKKSRGKIILVLVVAIIFAIYSYISYRGEFLEISEIGEGYIEIFNQNNTYLRYITLINFFVIFISVYITNIIIKKGLKKFFERDGKKLPKLANKSIAFALAVIVSIITSNWMLKTTMTVFNATQFNITDPIFGADVSFYMFQKPFIEMVIYYFLALIIGIAIYTGIYYIIAFNTFFESIDGNMLRDSSFIKQLLTYAMLIIIGIAVLVIIKTQGVVLNNFLTLNNEEDTVITGAGLTERIIEVWGYRILAVVMVIAVFMAIKAFKKQNSKKIIISLLSVPAYLVVMFVVMLGYQFVYVQRNELDKQKEYISKNIEFTKTAYNINIEEVEITNTGTLSDKDVDKYNNTITNIPIVTSDIVLSTLEETQGTTGYYIYNPTRPTLYDSQLAYMSPREISNESRTYNNKTYEYTHGYGVVITSASTVDESGNLLYLSNDFSNTDKITQPRIYYGLETNDTVVINKDSKEFDYPINSLQNAETTYEGTGGLQLGFIDRMILGINQGNIKLAFIDDDSSILSNRNIIKRAEKIMPYLLYDEEPYLVMTDEGSLVWVLDAYTISNQYPYSQSTTIEQNGSKYTLNYIRNSVKVIINAYDGTIDFYLTDRTDPIAMAYNNMYTTLFKDAGEIPEDVSSQFVYSKLLYNIQSEILKIYHSVSTDVLYRGDDVWASPVYSTSTTTTAGEEMSPYYTMLKTLDSDHEQLGLVLPYTLYGKQSIVSYLVGTANGADTKLTMYKFAQNNNILGPLQLNNMLSQDETIAAEISTLSVTGTRLIKNMIIVPIDDTLLYVVPIYQLSLNEVDSTPMLKKVVVASGTKVAIGSDLKEALENLLSSKNAVEIEVENTDTIEELIEAIIKANNNLNESSNITDWEQMGKDISRLQELIKKLEQLRKEEEKEAENITINDNDKKDTNTVNDKNNTVED